MNLQQLGQQVDCDVAALLAMTGGGSKTPRNDRLGRHELAITGRVVQPLHSLSK